MMRGALAPRPRAALHGAPNGRDGQERVVQPTAQACGELRRADARVRCTARRRPRARGSHAIVAACARSFSRSQPSRAATASSPISAASSAGATTASSARRIHREQRAPAIALEPEPLARALVELVARASRARPGTTPTRRPVSHRRRPRSRSSPYMKYSRSRPSSSCQASRRITIAAPDGNASRGLAPARRRPAAAVAGPADAEDSARRRRCVLMRSPSGSITAACHAPHCGRAAAPRAAARARPGGAESGLRNSSSGARVAVDAGVAAAGEPEVLAASRSRARHERARRARRCRRRRRCRRSPARRSCAQLSAASRAAMQRLAAAPPSRGLTTTTASGRTGSRSARLGGSSSARSRPRSVSASSSIAARDSSARRCARHLVLVGQARDDEREVQQDDQRSSRSPTANSSDGG